MSDNHFNLITAGNGFLNRFRKVTPEQGDPYYSMSIAARRGKPNKEGHVQKTYFDCNIVGSEAIEMAKQLESILGDKYSFDNNKELSVQIEFVFGDLEKRAFIYERGDRKGQTGYSLKGRLFNIKWYKVNGDTTVYSPAEIERKKLADGQANHQPADQSAADDQPDQTDAFQNELPQEVKLVRDDPFYGEREQQLMSQGYQYVGGDMWSLAGAA